MKMCPVCGNPGRQYLEAHAMDVADSKGMHYARCASCGIIYLNNEIETGDVDYSDSGYYQAKKPRFYRVIDTIMNMFMAKRLRFLRYCAESLKDKTVLDIGCGKGKFLYCAQQSGMKILGVEPTKRSYIAAKDKLGDVISNRAMDPGVFPKNHVDIITMWHVFEHLPEPISMLNTCKKVLRPKGCLIIAVPNFNSWIARLGGEVWFNLDPPRHLIHYSPTSLTNLLEHNGFSVIHLSYHYPELTYFSALQTMLNKTTISPNFLFNLLKRNKRAMPNSNIKFVLNVLFTTVLGILLFPAVLFFVPFTELIHKSDCITVVGRRND